MFSEKSNDLQKRNYEAIKDSYTFVKDSFDFEQNSLNFISDSVRRDFSINGSFVLKLSASLNKKDADLGASLTVLRPDSTYFTVINTLQRAGYAADRHSRHLVTPGIKQVIELTSDFTSIHIEKGSRLILTVALLKSPYLEVNYGSGKAVAEESIGDARIPVQLKLYGDSEIELPVYQSR